MQESKRRTDEELAEEAQRGEASATEELILRYNHAVRARARQFFLAGGETEDLVQEGMIGLYFAIRDYRTDSGKSFKNFAYLCVTRRIYDAIGRMTTKKSSVLTESVSLFDRNVLDISDERASPEEFLIDSEARAEFQVKLMRELSDFEYRVLNMYREQSVRCKKRLKIKRSKKWHIYPCIGSSDRILSIKWCGRNMSCAF